MVEMGIGGLDIDCDEVGKEEEEKGDVEEEVDLASL